MSCTFTIINYIYVTKTPQQNLQFIILDLLIWKCIVRRSRVFFTMQYFSPAQNSCSLYSESNLYCHGYKHSTKRQIALMIYRRMCNRNPLNTNQQSRTECLHSALLNRIGKIESSTAAAAAAAFACWLQRRPVSIFKWKI